MTEVRVEACLLGRQSVGRVKLEQRFQELTSSLFQSGNDLSIRALPLGESGFIVGEGGHTGPDFFTRGTKDAAIR
jgi:hypothetical protein